MACYKGWGRADINLKPKSTNWSLKGVAPKVSTFPGISGHLSGP